MCPGGQIGALTIEGEGELTIRPAVPGHVVELRQSKGDFYSFCCSYRDNGERPTIARDVSEATPAG